MKNFKKYFLISAGFIFGMAVLVSLMMGLKDTSSSRIAFIRSADLVNDYEGMSEMQEYYALKKLKWSAEIDSIKNIYSQQKVFLENQLEGLNEHQKQKLIQPFNLKASHWEKQIETIETNANEEDKRMTQNVLNQVNSFIRDYAKENNIDIVLGTTLSGNILYGEDYLDITDDVLVELNKNYLSVK